jgi:tetratricopeptide (TPR) repeat protein
MGQGGQQLSADPSLIALLLFVVLVTSCALPKIVVLEDTLTADQHNDLGYIYETKGMLDLAEKEYSLAAKKRTDWHVPWFNRGNLAFKKGDYRRAEDCLREALRRAPDNSDAMNNLANALLMQDRHREARQMIEQALRIESKEVYLDTLESIRKRESAASE